LPGPKNTVEAFNAIASEHEAGQRREQVLQAALKRDAEKKKAQEMKEEANKAPEENKIEKKQDVEDLEQEFEFTDDQQPNIGKNESAQNFKNEYQDEEDGKRENKHNDQKKVKKMSNDD